MIHNFEMSLKCYTFTAQCPKVCADFHVHGTYLEFECILHIYTITQTSALKTLDKGTKKISHNKISADYLRIICGSIRLLYYFC